MEKIKGIKPPSWIVEQEKLALHSMREHYFKCWKQLEEINEEYREKLKDIPLVMVGTPGNDSDYNWENVFYKPENYKLLNLDEDENK